ncbi:LacI family transcriptional regulator [Streptohalobacillus salinus]|uniref:LacI family transcriptional regulator n=1 Tax=Streptohalobacillus salinus TaxID=621096 RepID=A0A2V3WVG3_9BACI|nr:LacI family DNA-binding transcriptional regulator [Streptohalobacillus salinus]PXW93092.1 LacI family transcriptional regulator [Streptohalobacillus salinus]
MRIKDIAKLAGVSPATVSRVMNNNGYVKEDKRKAVLEVIEAVDYQPNEIAKSLKSQKSRMIGVIVPKISTETASRVVAGVTHVAKTAGYQVLIANTNLDIEEEIKYLKFLSNKSVDGIIMMGTEVTDRHLEVMNKLTIPIVILGQKVSGYTSIIHNDYDASYQMTEYLINQGHKAIGFIGVDEKDYAVGVLRKKGYLDCLSDYNLNGSDGLIAIGDFDIDTGFKMMKKILAKSQPTAVFAVTDHLAIGAIHALLDQGYRVPEDISVVGIGDIKLAEYLNPPLTTMHYTFKTSGQMAAEAVFDLIENNAHKGEQLMTSFQLKERRSVKHL